jgi:predicted RNA-binding protein
MKTHAYINLDASLSYHARMLVMSFILHLVVPGQAVCIVDVLREEQGVDGKKEEQVKESTK